MYDITFALGVIFGGITMWQMARDTENGEDEQDGSEAVSIDIVNEADEEADNNFLIESTPEKSDGIEEIQVVDIDTVSDIDSTTVEMADEPEAPVDKLQQIAGIGPTYSSRIYEAGIESVEDLAKLTAEKLQEIVTPGRSTPTAETEKWLDQARQLATA